MFPLLYYLPPLLGLERLDAKTVAAVVITQVFFSSVVGGLAHLRSGRVHGRIALVAGTASAVASFVGGVASKWTSRTISPAAFRHCYPSRPCHDVSSRSEPGAGKSFARKGVCGAGSLISMLVCHWDSHRLSWRGKFRLRSVADLYPQGPDTNCHRQQPLYRDDEYVLRISRQACYRPNTLVHGNGRGYRSQHRSAGWRENPLPASHRHSSLCLRRHGRPHRHSNLAQHTNTTLDQELATEAQATEIG